MEKIMETKKYILYRKKSEKRDILINYDKRTGARYSMDTKTFIELAENYINEVNKHD